MDLGDLNPFKGALPLMDAGWLLAEAPEHPSHVAMLLLFEPPPEVADSPGGVSDWVAGVVERARRAGHQLRSPLDLRLQRPHGLLGTYSWEVDPDPDLAWHVRHLALPRPGRVRELLSLVSRLHTPPLDRHRPMWEAHLIEGLADGRVALYFRVSHALMDGVGGMRLLISAFSEDPDERGMVPPWAIDPSASQAPSKLRPDAGTIDPTRAGLAGSVLATAVAAAAGNVQLSRVMATQVVRGVARRSSVSFPAPQTIFNQRLSASRRFVAQSYDIGRFRAVADAADATINDVVLAACGDMLRRYLDERGELPDDSLTALVPVSVRPSGGPSDGNALSATLTTLATDVTGPVQRLRQVKAGMDRAKQRMATMDRGQLSTFGTLLFGPVLLGQLTGTSARIPPHFNVIISNVPGPRTDLYWNGARMAGMYPLSLLFDGYPLNITQTSYVDSLDFGITADRRAVPQVQRMIDHLEDSLAALERELGVG